MYNHVTQIYERLVNSWSDKNITGLRNHRSSLKIPSPTATFPMVQIYIPFIINQSDPRAHLTHSASCSRDTSHCLEAVAPATQISAIGGEFLDQDRSALMRIPRFKIDTL